MKRQKIESALRQLVDQRGSAMELVVKGILSDSDYRSLADKLSLKTQDLKSELATMATEATDLESCVKFCGDFFRKFDRLWLEGDLNLRQRFQSFVFPQGIEFSCGEF